MSVGAVERALMAFVKAGPVSHPIKWPGKLFEPPEGSPWVRVEVLTAPVGEFGQVRGTGAPVRMSGSMIVTTLRPPKHGPGPLRADADAWAEYLKWRQSVQAGEAPNTFDIFLRATSVDRIESG